MKYSIEYYSDKVEQAILALPKTLQARYIALSSRMLEHGANLGEPHTKAFGGGLFELRLKGGEVIARVFYCTVVNRKIIMLHAFIKKTERTPLAERKIAESRLKEVKNEY